MNFIFLSIQMLRCYIVFLICFNIFYGCSSSLDIPVTPKLITSTEKERLNYILNELLDTIHITLDSLYNTEAYAELPEPIKKQFQISIIAGNLPVRVESSYYKGIEDAKRDINNGLLKHYSYGLDVIINNVPALPVYEFYLEYVYAIQSDGLAGCLVNQCIKAYNEGYERISIPVINKFYNQDVYNIAWETTEKLIGNNYRDDDGSSK